VDPNILESTLNKSAYNLGMDGQMFEIQYTRFKVYLQHNPPPKVIIQSVDCHTLCKTEGLYDYQQFLPFLKDSIMRGSLANFDGLSKNDFVIPMARYAGEFKLMLHAFSLLTNKANPAASNRSKGFEAQDRPWNNDLEAAKKMYPEKLQYDLNPMVIKQFEEYIRFCKSNKIQLILVYTPEYIEGQSLIKNRQAIINLYEKLALKYHIPFRNYSGSDLSMNRANFYNALHMNTQGARTFSARLASDIRPLVSVGTGKEVYTQDTDTGNSDQDVAVIH
jgi:hypothetical protein